MKILRGIPGKLRGGWAMMVTLFVILVAITTVWLMMTSSLTSSRVARVNKNSTSARYRAEGGVAVARRDLLQAVANWQPPPATGTTTIDGEPVDYDVENTGFVFVDTDPSGIQATHTRFQVQGLSRVHGSQETANQIVDAVSIPIFQFAVFYTEDLEINPGPNMTLRGRIHTNGDLFLNCGGTLTLDTNYVHAVGDIFRHRKDDPSTSQGNVDIREWVANPWDPSEPSSFFRMNSRSQMNALGVATTSGFDSNFTSGFDANGDGDFFDAQDWLPWTLGALDYWSEPDGYAGGSGSTVESSDHGLTAAVVPSINSTAPFEPAPSGGDYDFDPSTGTYVEVPPGTGAFQQGFFHGEADLSIVVEPNGSWKAYDSSGFEVTADLAGAVTLTTMYDARQGGDIAVTQIDMAMLNASGVFPDNGLLYASSYETGQGTALKGIELVNGTELAGPLTVVSDGAVYVQGDYNTVDQKGAAVISDAMNLLSNAWDGTKDPGQLPKATETTFNLAFISGNHETSVGSYNGGFENLPRFHENWSGVPCNITGSFVNAWLSQYATGAWQYGGDRYTAPNRNWAYDTRFNDVANLPPFTPLVVMAENVAFW